MAAVSEEEKHKRNTDCVYFLASPFTCKKGAECEFRHSESARINTRDCWFWLSGSCLNANCPFRHPPLERKPELPAAITVAAQKSRVLCYFYAQGYCARGDKCGFQHGVGPVTTTEAVKLSKPKVSEANHNQVSMNKGNESVTSKPLGNTYSSVQVDTESEHPFVYRDDVEVGRLSISNALGRLQEESGSSVRSRSHTIHDVLGGTRSRHRSAVGTVAKQTAGDNPTLISSAEDHNPEADVSIHDGQAEDEIARQANSADKGIQNGMDSGEIREESSFDVLVDDGSDQVIYEDEFDYLPSRDMLVDPMSGQIQRRMIVTEDLDDFNYDLSVYEQYFDGAVECGNQAYKSVQPAGYDPLVAFDHRGKHEWNEREVFFNDRRQSIPEEQYQRGISNNDLRNYLLRRRRTEHSHKNGDGHYWGKHHNCMTNGSQDKHRHDGRFPHQQDRCRRMQQGVPRSNKQNQQKSMRNKRTYRDVDVDHERNNSEKTPFKRMIQMEQHVGVSTYNEQGQMMLGDGEHLHSYGHSVSNNKRARIAKDDANFTGPKSLAQIKAEKMKICDDERSAHVDDVDHTCHQKVSTLKSRSTPVSSTSSSTHKDYGNMLSSKGLDFKGPKPLSEILKEKRKADIRSGRFREPQAEVKETEKVENPSNGASILLIKEEKLVKDSVQESLRHENVRSLQQDDEHVSPSQKQDNGNFGQGTDTFYVEGVDSALDDVELDDDEDELDDDEDDDFEKKLKRIFS